MRLAAKTKDNSVLVKENNDDIAGDCCEKRLVEVVVGVDVVVVVVVGVEVDVVVVVVVGVEVVVEVVVVVGVGVGVCLDRSVRRRSMIRSQQVLTEAEVKALPPLIPVIVAYGMGLDSTALLVEFARRGICPDLILFADTGGELPETYAYLTIINEWLRNVGFPQVTVVSLPDSPKAKYGSLYESLMTTQCLPPIVFNMKTCSQRWKGGPQNRYCNNWYRTKACWEAGYRAIKVIGYDAGNRDTNRYCETMEGFEESDDARKYVLWCPLIEWGLTREMLPEIITGAGLPLPIKSACAFCGARRKPELLEMAQRHPQLARQAVMLERNWRDGKHNNQKRTVKGLGRNFSWEEFLAENGHCYPDEEQDAPF